MTDAIAGIVKPLELESIIWGAMKKAAEAGPPRHGSVPEYDPRGNGDMEIVARDAAARILAAIDADALQAMIGAAYEAAAGIMDVEARRWAEACNDWEEAIWRGKAEAIRALTPADASAALARRDARMRAEGRQAGLIEAATVKINIDGIGPSALPQRWREAILALAAQTEEAANG